MIKFNKKTNNDPRSTLTLKLAIQFNIYEWFFSIKLLHRQSLVQIKMISDSIKRNDKQYCCWFENVLRQAVTIVWLFFFDLGKSEKIRQICTFRQRKQNSEKTKWKNKLKSNRKPCQCQQIHLVECFRLHSGELGANNSCKRQKKVNWVLIYFSEE